MGVSRETPVGSALHPFLVASVLGSVAAAMACESDGNNPIGPEEVIERLDRVEKQTLMQPVAALARGSFAF